MTIAQDVEYSIIGGTSVQALIELSTLAVAGSHHPELQTALEEWGDTTGETFLHCLGLCLDLTPPRSLQSLAVEIRGMDPMEFRRLILGETAWSWRNLVGQETISEAASGEDEAIRRLLSNDRYYAGVADRSLQQVLKMSARETQERFLAILDSFAQSTEVEVHSETLAKVTSTAESLASQKGWEEAIEILTGYRYIPEPEAPFVVLMPHLARDGLSLVQHNETRMIVYGARAPKATEQLAAEIGRALTDPSRIQILSALKRGATRLGELMTETGLARSTVHHHLRELREVGVVAVSGNARSYTYELSDVGRHQGVAAIKTVLGLDSEGAKDD